MPADVLSEVLAALELSTDLYFRAELGEPFAIEVPEQAPGVIRFHAVAAGACRIALAGDRAADARPVRLGPGDLVLVPHGSAHRLAGRVDPPHDPVPLACVLASSGFDGEGPLVYGGPQRGAVLVCGHFAFGRPGVAADDRTDLPLHPIVASLPPLLVVSAGEGPGHAWLEPVLRQVEGEARARRTGYRELVRRLSEILLIQVLRAHAETGESAALSALADAHLGRALEAMHGRPEADWSLERLARVAGQSRTLFAERFRERMGEPPMRYLARWRLEKARNLLARHGLPVAEAARRVGYVSESAFHRAFRERFGVSPGLLRRNASP